MNNRLYVQINESTDITAGKYIDGSVFVSAIDIDNYIKK